MYTGHPPRRRRAGSGPVVLAAAKRILSRRQSHVGVRCHSASFGWPRHHGLWHILVLRVAAVPLFGLEIGLLLGQWLTGDIGLLAIILGIVGAVILFGAAYLLEPYRRVLLGLSAGALVGLSIASFLGLDHFVGGVLGAHAAMFLNCQPMPTALKTIVSSAGIKPPAARSRQLWHRPPCDNDECVEVPRHDDRGRRQQFGSHSIFFDKGQFWKLKLPSTLAKFRSGGSFGDVGLESCSTAACVSSDSVFTPNFALSRAQVLATVL